MMSTCLDIWYCWSKLSQTYIFCQFQFYLLFENFLHIYLPGLQLLTQLYFLIDHLQDKLFIRERWIVTTALTSRSCWFVWISSPLVSDNCIHASFFSLMAIFLSLKHMFMFLGWVKVIDLKCYSSLRPALAMREEEASLGWASLLGYY